VIYAASNLPAALSRLESGSQPGYPGDSSGVPRMGSRPACNHTRHGPWCSSMCGLTEAPAREAVAGVLACPITCHLDGIDRRHRLASCYADMGRSYHQDRDSCPLLLVKA
jgi:hypothetical protein